MQGYHQVRSHMILQRDGKWAYRKYLWELKKEEVRKSIQLKIDKVFLSFGYVPKEKLSRAEQQTENYIRIAKDVHYELQKVNARLAQLTPPEQPLWKI